MNRPIAKICVFFFFAAFLVHAFAEPGKAIDPKDLSRFYRPLFQDPYEYMFSSDPKNPRLNIRGKNLGTFMAGVRGFMFYFSFVACVHEWIKPLKCTGEFDETSCVEQMSGIKVFKSRSTTLAEFSHYNPAIVTWGYSNLIPNPADEFHGQTVRKIYQIIFRRFFRLMVMSYFYVHEGNAITEESDLYKMKMKEKKFEALEFLAERFKGILLDYQAPADGTTFTPPMAAGFWIRRHLDGTDEELWKGLNKFMTLYDPAWFEEASGNSKR